MIHAAFLIPLFPLAGFAVLAPFGRKIGVGTTASIVGNCDHSPRARMPKISQSVG